MRSNFVFLNISFLTIIMSILTINSINNDEISNGYPYLLSLPINRKIYIVEKYFFGLILGVVTMFIIWIMSLMIGIIPTNRWYDFASIACFLSFPLMITVQSFMIPIKLMINDIKGKYAIVFIIAILFSIVFVGSRFLVSYIYSEYYSLQIFSKLIFSMNFSTLMIVWLLISFMLLLISVKISINIFNKKEF
ncbi:MAG: ABC-2 transporter permease [Erysipelotrichaceae bacterium]|nr:ABC-2 transporter permease [Erysipelotrichaceae bacterium]